MKRTCPTSKSDNKFVNNSKEQQYELEDWLYHNGFSKKPSNVDALKTIVEKKIKNGNTANNITWDGLMMRSKTILNGFLL